MDEGNKASISQKFNALLWWLGLFVPGGFAKKRWFCPGRYNATTKGTSFVISKVIVYMFSTALLILVDQLQFFSVLFNILTSWFHHYYQIRE